MSLMAGSQLEKPQGAADRWEVETLSRSDRRLEPLRKRVRRWGSV